MNINVYEELGHPNAQEQFLKAKVVSMIGEIIKRMELTQTQVAEMAGLTQPQISNILRGKFRDISLEKLFRILIMLNHSIRIYVDDAPSEKAEIVVGMKPKELVAA